MNTKTRAEPAPKQGWRIEVDSHRGLHHFGLDSEGTGREAINLLSAPVRVSFTGGDWSAARWEQNADGQWRCAVPTKDGRGRIDWRIDAGADEMLWRLDYHGTETIDGLLLEMEFDCLQAASALIPFAVDQEGRGLGPWLLVSTDFGHLLLAAESEYLWTALNEGQRSGWFGFATKRGVDPSLRGKDWIEAAQIPGYLPGKIRLQLKCQKPCSAGPILKLRFTCPELKDAQGIAPADWRAIRRAYLNSWQPCGTWSEKEMVWVLANNVLSDPASISLMFYAEPMLFCREPVEGFDLLHLLKHSLDYWISHHVSHQGHVNAFRKMYDLYPVAGCGLITSAWVYWTLSHDQPWLNRNLPWLHLMADYLLRRDVDGDGLLEDYLGGVPGRLRDPERANIWFEYVNFGFKNSYFNALAYRALMCLAEMFEAAHTFKTYASDDICEDYRLFISRAGICDATAITRAAAYYRREAAKLKAAFRNTLLGANGWFVSWIDVQGQVHDYCHTFINGMAVAYGIVTPTEGRAILQRVVEQSKSIGFHNWHLGVPANLIPLSRLDMIQSRMGIDGVPLQDEFSWPADLTEEKAFGYRYTNGTIHPTLVWPYLLGLQVAGLEEEAERILSRMIDSAQRGLFMNGIVNAPPGGAEHFFFDGKTCGYEGYLPESYNFLMAVFTRDVSNRKKLLGPLCPKTK